jgi:hypothetical protein
MGAKIRLFCLSGGPPMLPMTELEYTGIVEKLKALDERFTVRP